MAKGVNIGGGWLKKNERGESISLSVNEEIFNINPTQCWLNLYPNEKKSKPTQPDFNFVATPKEVKAQARIDVPGTIPTPFPRPKNFAPQTSKPKITPRVQPTDLDNALDGPPDDLWSREDAGPQREF